MKEEISKLKKTYADLVVFGSIYTADVNNPIAQAIAIKDGKFIYVGNKENVTLFIKEGFTKIINHNKGMIMPGCTDGHSHYIMKFIMNNIKGSVDFAIEDDKTSILRKLDEATLIAKNSGKKTLFGFGWNYITLRNDPPTLEELDKVTHGISTLIFDQGGHHAFCNSECLKCTGIIDDNKNVLIKEIEGGYLELDENNYPTGYSEERATGYFMRNGGVDYEELVDDSVAELAIKKTQEFLLSTGYTMVLDGWSNMFHPSKLYEAANRLDNKNELKIVLPMTYEVEPWQKNLDLEIEYLLELKNKYSTRHVKPEYLKVFMDGVVETKTGAMIKPYKDGSIYKSFWSTNRLVDITKKCNSLNLTVHSHVMGDAAIKETIDAYIKGGNNGKRNCLVHLRNVSKEDFKRLNNKHIACTAGFTWHASSDEQDNYLKAYLDDEYVYHAYPIKSFFDAGVKVSSHSDYPANIPCPQDPFGIMHVAINGKLFKDNEEAKPYDTNELVNINQVFEALTINGAYQFGLENERGSIEVGKWADFVLADNDVFKCPKNMVGNTKVVSTWFEGEKVFENSLIKEK